jgi:hypothetical protein
MYSFFENLLTFISNHTKDFVNICFWVFTGILGFLTYKNAKKTLFNPIRSEMIKYQMKVITDFIDRHTSKGHDFDTSINYSNLLKLNYETDYLFDTLTDERKFDNHIFDELDSNRLNFCKENLGGLFEIRIIDKELSLDTVYGDFETTKQYIQTKHIKDKEKKFKDIFLQRLYLTKQFYEFYTDLINLQTNPFVPDILKNEISEILSNIYINVGELYKLLTIHISEQTETNYQGIYSQFIDKKIDHNIDLQKLRNAITKYFKVNKI